MDERDETLAIVASLYYQLDLGQAEIAERFGVSTSKISRMLKQARNRGIVEIKIHMPIPRDVELEQKLIQTFGLRDAVVLQVGVERDEGRLTQATGRLAASYLQRAIKNFAAGASIGVAWGTSVYAAVSSLPVMNSLKVDVVQLVGGVGALAVDGPDLSRMVAARLGGRHYDLHAPLVVERVEVRTVLFSEPAVRDGLTRARNVKLAITGIGSVQDNASSFLRAGLLTPNDLENLRASGAVGEMVGRFFTAEGAPAPVEVNQRIIGVELHDLHAIPQVVAVARGLAKVDAILGALRGRYISVLATDDVTARALLEKSAR
jgi:DNA-binding transcriptional regulator LsrR (DeoR family)